MRLSRRAFAASAAALASRAFAQDIVLGADPARVGQEAGAVPFALEGGHIMLNAAIGGAGSAPFFLDTGAALTSLDSAFAGASRIATRGGARATGVRGAQVDAGVAQGLDVNFAGLALRDRAAVVLDMPNDITDRGAQARLAGLLGCNVFNADGIAFDFRARTLTWLTGPPAAAPGDVSIPLKARIAPRRDGGAGEFVTQLTVSLTFGGVSGDFILDTGAGAGVQLSRAFAERIGLLDQPGRQVAMLTPGGIDGYQPVILLISPAFSAGDFPMPPRVISVARDAPPMPEQKDFFVRLRRASVPQAAGIIGLLAFNPIRAAIDIAGQQLILTPGSRVLPPRLVSFGLSLAKPTHEAFKVLSVIDGTPAQAQTIRPGARIVQIGGQPAAALSPWQAAGLMNRQGKSVEIAFDDGRKLTTQTVQVLP